MLKDKKCSDSSKNKDQSYWHEMIAQYQTSGLSLKEFCAANKIPFSSLKNRIYRLKKSEQPQDIPLFRPIVIEQPPIEQVSASCGEEAALILELSGIRIIVPSNFGEETLRRLLNVVRDVHV